MVAASMAGAWKAYLESQGLGLAWYRDGAPTDVAAPYGVITEAIGLSPNLKGQVIVELVQVDLWQPSRRSLPDGRVVPGEDYRLPEDVAARLRGRGVEPFCPWHIFGVRADGRRWPPSDNLVRHTWTVTVHRSVDRKAAA